MTQSPRFLTLSAGIVLSIPLCVLNLQAQEEHGREPIRPSIFYEAVNLIADDTAKSRIDFNFNIPLNFFVFVRSVSNPNDFIARGEISVEVLNPGDQSAARDIVHKELHRSEPTALMDSGRGVQGSFSFTLDPGTYRTIFEVNDLESRRRVVDSDREVVLKRFGGRTQVFSSILILNRLDVEDDSSERAYLVNIGGDAIFGKNFSLLFQSTGAPGSAETVHYTLRKLDNANKRVSVLEDSARPNPRFTNCRLKAVEADSELMYSLRPRKNGPQVNTYLVDIRGDTLDWGQYDIEIKGSGNAVLRKSFAIRWLTMPRTLANNALATEALQYLMSENEFEDFMKLSDNDMKKQFGAFWKKRDPTPETAYNEAMAEYYQRCDYALENFRTLGHADGIRTDRGKTYVLYGPPTKTDRLLTPNAPPREIWDYESLQLRFVFIDESGTGNYKLLSSEKL